MKQLLFIFLFSVTALNARAEAMRPAVEPVMGFVTSVNGVQIQAASGGCTTKDSFVIQKERMGNVTALTLVRVDFDPCLALFMYGVRLDYSYEELGLRYNENFIIRNPVTFSTVK